MDPGTIIALLFLAAYGPSILFTIIIARAKRYRREPGSAIVKAFLWGATGAAAIALVVNTVTQGAFVRPALRDEAAVTVVVAVVVAPFVEELVKPLVLYMGTVKRNCDELVDGLIYGAVAGLGFAATENLFYETSALMEQGTEGFIATAIARTFSATLLHAVASAIVGYGIALHLNRRWGGLLLVPIFLCAVLLHAAYNAFVIAAPGFLIIPLFAIAIWGFFFVRRRIHNMSLVPPTRNWIVVGGQTPPQEAPSGPETVEARPPPQRWRPVPSSYISPTPSTQPPRPPVPPENEKDTPEKDDSGTHRSTRSATRPEGSPTWRSDAPWAPEHGHGQKRKAEQNQERWDPVHEDDGDADADRENEGGKRPGKRRRGP